jgi:hypothetical protein
MLLHNQCNFLDLYEVMRIKFKEMKKTTIKSKDIGLNEKINKFL